jgi:hypothetical protein
MTLTQAIIASIASVVFWHYGYTIEGAIIVHAVLTAREKIT